MAKDSEEENSEDPGMVVTVSLPALIMSGSTLSSVGYGPMPRRPFSLCNSIDIPGVKKFEASVGMPEFGERRNNWRKQLEKKKKQQQEDHQ